MNNESEFEEKIEIDLRYVLGKKFYFKMFLIKLKIFRISKVRNIFYKGN